MLRNRALLVLLALVAAGLGLATTVSGLQAADDEGWIAMFDGKSLTGWKASEATDSFRVADGVIVAQGNPRSHLFYQGQDRPFVNFEFECEVMTKPNANAGIYFHTKYQETGWPKYGLEAQINNTYTKDPIKTGSLYKVVDLNTAPAQDNEWFKYNIRVEGRHVVVKVNDKQLVDYTEPEGKQPGTDFTRVLDKGTFALQAHDPGSQVLFRNLRVRRLQ